MKILVSLKRVPDADSRIRVLADGTGIETDGLKYAVNPFDSIALEEALRLREKSGAGEIVVGMRESRFQVNRCREVLGCVLQHARLHQRLTEIVVGEEVVARRTAVNAFVRRGKQGRAAGRERVDAQADLG